MRGEYIEAIDGFHSMPELPPRARRIHSLVRAGDKDNGTTSACAENTLLGVLGIELVGNYLRVRGEYLGSGGWIRTSDELPPRARRIP